MMKHQDESCGKSPDGAMFTYRTIYFVTVNHASRRKDSHARASRRWY